MPGSALGAGDHSGVSVLRGLLILRCLSLWGSFLTRLRGGRRRFGLAREGGDGSQTCEQQRQGSGGADGEHRDLNPETLRFHAPRFMFMRLVSCSCVSFRALRLTGGGTCFGKVTARACRMGYTASTAKLRFARRARAPVPTQARSSHTGFDLRRLRNGYGKSCNWGASRRRKTRNSSKFVIRNAKSAWPAVAAWYEGGKKFRVWAELGGCRVRLKFGHRRRLVTDHGRLCLTAHS